jgi:hypothetical protein
MKKQDLIKALGELGFPLVVAERQGISQKKVMEVLDSLISSGDPRLVEGFPVILANIRQRDISLDLQAFVSKHGPRSVKRHNLEKLLLISYELLNEEDLQGPEGLDSMAEPLRAKYGDLFSSDEVALGRNVSASMSRMRNTLKRYTTSLRDEMSAREKESLRQQQAFQLHMHLSKLFSPKQKELVLKKLKGEAFTKTEQEYYSRVVKKKLEALTNSELRRIATKLTRK